MSTKLAREVVQGDRFPSPRREEGIVKAVCDFGRCDQDDRPDSVHVRGLVGSVYGNEWFIALIRDEELHVCDEDCPSFLTEHTDEERDAHLRSNSHQR